MNQTSVFQAKPKPQVRRPANFAEALMEIGGQAVSQAKNVASGVLSGSLDSLTGNYPSGSADHMPNSQSDFERALREQEEQFKREQARLQRHREVIATPIFNRQEEETKKQIEVLQDELKKLAQEIGKMESSVNRAIKEEVVEPGTYHVNFFVKLREFLVQLRKKVTESQDWLAASYQRKQKKNVFWGGVKKSGTKFMLSQERYMSTQAG